MNPQPKSGDSEKTNYERIGSQALVGGEIHTQCHKQKKNMPKVTRMVASEYLNTSLWSNGPVVDDKHH